MTTRAAIRSVALALLTATACSGTSGGDGKPGAVAILEGRSGQKTVGTATFTSVATGGVRILVELQDAAPGPHAVHLHEVGDCSAPDASSAGPHFDPDQHPHGGPGSAPHHAGDFGNMTVGTDGRGYLELVTPDLTIEGPRGVVGRSLVVHENVDDLASQPAGNSGARIACGVVIGAAP